MAKRRQTFISVITVICVVGVALGVAVITVVLSVMNGFESMWHEKIFGTAPTSWSSRGLGPFERLRRRARGRDLEVPGVVGATPFLVTEAMLRRRAAGDIQAVLLKGIDPADRRATTRLAEDLVLGSLDTLDARRRDGDEALPGRGDREPSWPDRFLLAVGDPVILISPLGGAPTPLGPAPAPGALSASRASSKPTSSSSTSRSSTRASARRRPS